MTYVTPKPKTMAMRLDIRRHVFFIRLIIFYTIFLFNVFNLNLNYSFQWHLTEANGSNFEIFSTLLGGADVTTLSINKKLRIFFETKNFFCRIAETPTKRAKIQLFTFKRRSHCAIFRRSAGCLDINKTPISSNYST